MGHHRLALLDLTRALELETSNRQLRAEVSKTREQIRNAMRKAPRRAIPVHLAGVTGASDALSLAKNVPFVTGPPRGTGATTEAVATRPEELEEKMKERAGPETASSQRHREKPRPSGVLIREVSSTVRAAAKSEGSRGSKEKKHGKTKAKLSIVEVEDEDDEDKGKSKVGKIGTNATLTAAITTATATVTTTTEALHKNNIRAPRTSYELDSVWRSLKDKTDELRAKYLRLTCTPAGNARAPIDDVLAGGTVDGELLSSIISAMRAAFDLTTPEDAASAAAFVRALSRMPRRSMTLMMLEPDAEKALKYLVQAVEEKDQTGEAKQWAKALV